MAKEIEAKFYPVSINEFRLKLERVNAKLVHQSRLMRRKTFDFVNISLPVEHYKWVRVRDEGDKVTLNIKYLINENRIDNVEEVELIVDSFEKSCEFLTLSGLTETNYQENYRETYVLFLDAHNQKVEITLDTWPGLETFVEIEAFSEQLVKTTAQLLGLDYSRAVFGSVDFLYEKVLNIPAGKLTKIPVLTFKNAKEVLNSLATNNLNAH